MTQRHIETIKKMNNSKPFWAKPIITPSSPLTKTLHPKNRFEDEDRKIREEILAAASVDEPIDIGELVKPSCDQAEPVKYGLQFYLLKLAFCLAFRQICRLLLWLGNSLSLSSIFLENYSGYQDMELAELFSSEPVSFQLSS